jgi:DNA polymerase-4
MRGGIRDRVGDCLGSSVGLARGRFLAKTACGMKKPNGLTVLRADALPGPLLDRPLRDYPGIGRRMEARLKAAGIETTLALWTVSARQARRLWNSTEGERLWRGLHGLDSEETPEAPQASISHGHVLAAALRMPDKARPVARRLVVKCGARLRRLGLTGSELGLHVDLEEDSRRRHFTAALKRRLRPTNDTFAPLRPLEAMWGELEPELHGRRIRYVGVAVSRLAPVGARPSPICSAGRLTWRRIPGR